VPESWVVDASTLIALGSIGRLHLLTSLADEVVVPEVVAHELLRVADNAAVAFSRSSIRREVVGVDDFVARWSLGPGETAVLSFARQNAGFVAVLDDLAARRCAQVLGIRTRGTVGITLLAKSNGIVAAVRPILEELRATGFYLSEGLMAHVLSLANERD
jgi:predicted nucleic acid-binding protein